MTQTFNPEPTPVVTSSQHLVKKQVEEADISCLEGISIQSLAWRDFKMDDPVFFKRFDDTIWRKGHFAGIRDVGNGPVLQVCLKGTTWTGALRYSAEYLRKPTSQELEEEGLNRNFKGL